MPGVPQDKIEARAYEIWEQEGKPHGRDLEHWTMATMELVPVKPKAKAAPAAKPKAKAAAKPKVLAAEAKAPCDPRKADLAKAK